MRLLLIDDQPELTKSLQLSLEAECFVVDVASDGHRGSFLGRTTDYDLIILDYNLPKKSGLEVCHDIRGAGKTTPILILSVESDVDKKITLLNTGADDYLTKPFSFQELLARIRAILRRPAAQTTTVLSLDDLKLDTHKHLARRGDQEIYLTKKEFMLLEHLLRQQGNVVSRGALMEHVWEADSDIFSNTIETHILTLRRKIDLANKNKLIHTIPGRGYKMSLIR